MKLKAIKKPLKLEQCYNEGCQELGSAKIYNKTYCAKHYFEIRSRNRLIRKLKKEHGIK